MAIGCENKVVYFFTAKTFLKTAKVRVYDDIISLHFADSSVLLCGQIEGACSLVVYDNDIANWQV